MIQGRLKHTSIFSHSLILRILMILTSSQRYVAQMLVNLLSSGIHLKQTFKKQRFHALNVLTCQVT